MEISKKDYKKILDLQLNDKLTIFIDNAGFRKFFFDSDPNALSEKIDENLHGRLKVIKILSNLDSLALIVSIILAFPAFGWFSLLFSPVLVVVWFVYRGFSSWRKQSIWPAILLILCSLFVLIFFYLPNVWVLLIIITSTLVFSFVRILYYTNSKIVFNLIHSNYKFFNLFYEKSEGVVIPLIWTKPEYPLPEQAWRLNMDEPTSFRDLGNKLLSLPERGATTDYNKARLMEANTPNVSNAWTHVVPALAKYAKYKGKRSLFWRDKGEKAYQNLEKKLHIIVLALYGDGLLSQGSSNEECLLVLLNSLVTFKEIYPNWDDAYCAAYKVFVDEREKITLVLDKHKCSVEAELFTQP